jgi:hypothetical protein
MPPRPASPAARSYIRKRNFRGIKTIIWEKAALGDVFFGITIHAVDILYTAYLIISTLLVGPHRFYVGEDPAHLA